MNPWGVANAVGAILLFVAVALCVPLAVSIGYADGDASAFVITIGITCAAGAALFLPTRGRADLGSRDGFGVVTFGWTAVALFGSLPFLISGEIPGVTDAFFETMSGFTTTGASILSDIEALPHGVAFWRCFMQWLGGMGIIVLSLAILPMLGVGGMQLYAAEAPGPTKEKLTPRIRQTAVLLWGVYLVLSIGQAVALRLAGMNWFEAACHTFTTMATGGFSTRGASIAAFESPLIEWIIIVFMVMAGTNFALHWRIRGRPWRLFRDAEWRFYAGTLVVFSAVIAAGLWLGAGRPAMDSVRSATFQAVSLITTTGYATDDYELWHPFLQFLVFLMLFIGGCGGSTGGGFKVIRVQIVLKAAIREIRTVANPRVVQAIQLGRGNKLEPGIPRNVLGFFVLYVAMFLVGGVVLSFEGMDLTTALSTSATAISNVGPGLGGVGPTDNFGWISGHSKWFLSFQMLLGRLEVYTVLALFLPQLWKR